MENIEYKIKNKLADAELTDISDAARSRMWSGIATNVPKPATDRGIASRAPHMKVVHSRTVPVETASQFAWGIFPKLAIASAAIAAIIGMFFFVHDNDTAASASVQPQQESQTVRTERAGPVHLEADPVVSGTVLGNASNAVPQSADADTSPQLHAARHARSESAAQLANNNKKAGGADNGRSVGAKPADVPTEGGITADDTQLQTVLPADGGERAKPQAADEPSAAASVTARDADTVSAKKKPVVIQTTEEIIIKKRSKTGKQKYR